MRVYRDDQKFLTFRINVMIWTIVAVFVFLAGSFWFVQGVQAEKFRNMSESNALREIVVPAKRGLIMDRNGRILADNQPAYALSLDRVVMRPLVKADPTHEGKLHQFLAQTLGVSMQEIQARFDKGKVIPRTHPLGIGEDLTIPQVASIEAGGVEFPELDVEPVQRRNYPYGTMAAHVMGYIGEATEKDLARDKSLRGGDLLGKKGVELVYNEFLRGKDGADYWEYDSHGRRLAEYTSARKEPVAGNNVYLTIDFELQRRAEQYFNENELVGAAVALDPRNGEVLAMISSPAFNPNVYSKRFTPETWKTIVSNPFKIELNRAIQGTYSPGSVFKTVMSMAGLVNHAIDVNSTVDCTGSGVFFGRRFRCWQKNGHGVVNVVNAIKGSCDVFFYTVGSRLGVDKISEYAHKLGLGEISKIDLDGEKAGLVPSTQWAADKQHRKWYPSETISVAIGQGPLIVTPLQIANMMSSIANGGTVYRPHVVRQIDQIAEDGSVTHLQVAPKILHKVELPAEAVEAVKKGLWKVVNEDGGTGGNARIAGLDICGKTGTVQVISYKGGFVKTEFMPFREKDHGWFASFATLQSPQMVVVVFSEHGGHGGVDGAPVAKLLYEAKYKMQLQTTNLNLNDPETLQKLKEGDLPTPGQAPKRPPEALGPGMGH